MTYRSKKLLDHGNQQYFNEKRPVNLRVQGTARLAELFSRPRGRRRMPAITVNLSEVGDSEAIPLAGLVIRTSYRLTQLRKS